MKAGNCTEAIVKGQLSPCRDFLIFAQPSPHLVRLCDYASLVIQLIRPRMIVCRIKNATWRPSRWMVTRW